MSKGLVYASIDIEADGPNPMKNNMVSIGIVFTDESGKILHEYEADLKPLEGHEPDPITMDEFWSKHESEWARIQREGRDYKDVMLEIYDLCTIRFKDHNVKWLAKPAAFDWQWVSSYAYLAFGYQWPYFKATCISTLKNLYWDLTNLSREEMSAKEAEWTKGTSMTHRAVDDARYQAALYHGVSNALRDLVK